MLESMFSANGNCESQGHVVVSQNSTRIGAFSCCVAILICSTSGLSFDIRDCKTQHSAEVPFVECLSSSVSTYNVNTLVKECVGMESQGENLKTLDSFISLEENWDFNGALPLSPQLISMMRGLILILHHQPSISPTARDSIQFEYENGNGDYLEFELFSNGEIKSFFMDADGETHVIDVSFDNPQKINEVVDAFYGNSVC